MKPHVRCVCALAAVVLTSAGNADAAGSAGVEFPAPFRGDWYDDAGPCDRDPEGPALTVGPRTLDYYDEFGGRLTAIVKQSRRAVRYQAEYHAEGHRWTVTETLRLSADGREMVLRPERTSPRYYRCAA